MTNTEFDDNLQNLLDNYAEESKSYDSSGGKIKFQDGMNGSKRAIKDLILNDVIGVDERLVNVDGFAYTKDMVNMSVHAVNNRLKSQRKIVGENNETISCFKRDDKCTSRNNLK